MEMVNKSLLGSLSIHKVKSNCKSSFKQYYTPVDENDKTLVFESKFESGNLNLAIKLSDNEYNLMLQNDINTNGHTQWFFFRVSNTTKDLTVKFNILNLSKPDSLYNYGMKVLCLSHQKKANEGVDWYRDGQNILYYKNCFRREGKFGMEKSYYTLTFTYTFPYDQDTVYFCYSLPYTYTDLCDDLTSVMNEQKTNTFVSRNTLCRTLAGNKCEYLTITSKETLPENHPNRVKKKGVVISARVHPGESVGSWMMKGVIDFLTSECLEAQALRKLFVFKIIPMLNPDGVINGNYRCSLAGVDLNRRWRAPSKMIHPTVYETKKLCRNFHKEREITLFCDLHGHSRKKNIFMYGNAIQENPTSTRLFPYIMSKLCDYFSFKYSRFSLTKSKETTARISLYRELNIPCIYTMEASFCGANQGELADLHFNEEHLVNIGRKLIFALIPYCKIDPYEVVYGKKQIAEIRDPANKEDLNLDDIMKEFKENENDLIKDSDANSSAGSDSEPSEDNLSDSEIAKIMPTKNKKKKAKKIVTQNSLNKRKKELEDKLKEKNKKREEEEKLKKSQFKRVSNYKNALKDRFNLSRIK